MNKLAEPILITAAGTKAQIATAAKAKPANHGKERMKQCGYDVIVAFKLE